MGAHNWTFTCNSISEPVGTLSTSQAFTQLPIQLYSSVSPKSHPLPLLPVLLNLLAFSLSLLLLPFPLHPPRPPACSLLSMSGRKVTAHWTPATGHTADLSWTRTRRSPRWGAWAAWSSCSGLCPSPTVWRTTSAAWATLTRPTTAWVLLCTTALCPA